MDIREIKGINRMEAVDITEIMKIWLDANINTHTFINPNYWLENYVLAKEMILVSDVYTYRLSGDIIAFVGLKDTYVAGIFVSYDNRCNGIGRELLNYIKNKHNILTLAVYEKNSRAVNFYVREGFNIMSKQVDEGTGEMEFLMKWEGNK